MDKCKECNGKLQKTKNTKERFNYVGSNHIFLKEVFECKKCKHIYEKIKL